MQRYETVLALMGALKKRGIQATREEVEASIEYLGLRDPFGSGDLDELMSRLGAEHTVNQRVLRVARVLSAQEWSDSVLAVRMELRLPPTGLPEDAALELHQALLVAELEQRADEEQVNAQVGRPATQFWKELIAVSRRLCTKLGIDPRPLDNLRESYAAGTGNTLFGVRRLLSPEAVIKVGGNEVSYVPTQVDYLIGHVLWGLPLNPETMEPKPSVTYEWQLLADGSGRFVSHIFNEKGTTASELKELKKRMRGCKRIFEHYALLAISASKPWRGLAWEGRWRKWNQLYPDFARQTEGALRKACQYAANNRQKIRTRFEQLAQPPS